MILKSCMKFKLALESFLFALDLNLVQVSILFEWITKSNMLIRTTWGEMPWVNHNVFKKPQIDEEGTQGFLFG